MFTVTRAVSACGVRRQEILGRYVEISRQLEHMYVIVHCPLHLMYHIT